VWGQWGEMNHSLYAHMNNKRKMKKKNRFKQEKKKRKQIELDRERNLMYNKKGQVHVRNYKFRVALIQELM
jgi:hypothetical protein